MPLSASPPIEAILRSPLGEVRVWIERDLLTEADDAHAVRTSVRLDYADDPAVQQVAIGRVVNRMADVLRGMNLGRLALDGPSLSPFSAWIAARAILDPAARTLSRDLYADYRLHAVGVNGRVMSAKAFGDALRDRGCGAAGKDIRGLQYRGGIRLRFPTTASEPTPDPAAPTGSSPDAPGGTPPSAASDQGAM